MSPFPALDPEPPPRPLWRSALIPTGVVAVVAVVVVLAVTLFGGGSSAKPPDQHAPGRHATWPSKVPGEVIGWSSSAHTLLAMSPTGQLHDQPVLLSGVIHYPPVSPSGFGILTRPGYVFYLENRGLTAGPPPFAGAIHPHDVYGSSPFAAHDNALVVGGLALTGFSQTPVTFNLNTSDRRRLPGGIADQVVGDPATMGAWVTVVAGALPADHNFFPQQADGRVEYRTPGKPPAVLTTTFGLRSITGFKGINGLHLTVFPSPSGHLIAVDVLDTGTNMPSPEDIVVFTRTGQVVSKLSVPGLTAMAWSNSGGQLFVLQSGDALTTWSPGSGASETSALPDEPGGWDGCIYSPSGTYLVCAGFGGNQQVNEWALVRLSDRAVVTEPASVFPVDWSP